MLVIDTGQAFAAVTDDLLGYGVGDTESGEARANRSPQIVELPVGFAAQLFVHETVEPGLDLTVAVEGLLAVKAENEVAVGPARQLSKKRHGVLRQRHPMSHAALEALLG